MRKNWKGANKYRNKKIKTEDGAFDSVKEFERWEELKKMCVAGKIRKLHRQCNFVLIPAQYAPSWTGKRGALHRGKLLERSCNYIADFVYEEKTEGGKWVAVVEDCKGVRTADYIIKRKLMLYRHKIRIRET